MSGRFGANDLKKRLIALYFLIKQIYLNVTVLSFSQRVINAMFLSRDSKKHRFCGASGFIYPTCQNLFARSMRFSMSFSVREWRTVSIHSPSLLMVNVVGTTSSP